MSSSSSLPPSLRSDTVPGCLLHQFLIWVKAIKVTHHDAIDTKSVELNVRYQYPIPSAARRIIEYWLNIHSAQHSSASDEGVSKILVSILDEPVGRLISALTAFAHIGNKFESIHADVHTLTACWTEYRKLVDQSGAQLFKSMASKDPSFKQRFIAQITLSNMFTLNERLKGGQFLSLNMTGTNLDLFWELRSQGGTNDVEYSWRRQKHEVQPLALTMNQEFTLSRFNASDQMWSTELTSFIDAFTSYAVMLNDRAIAVQSSRLFTTTSTRLMSELTQCLTSLDRISVDISNDTGTFAIDNGEWKTYLRTVMRSQLMVITNYMITPNVTRESLKSFLAQNIDASAAPIALNPVSLAALAPQLQQYKLIAHVHSWLTQSHGCLTALMMRIDGAYPIPKSISDTDAVIATNALRDRLLRDAKAVEKRIASVRLIVDGKPYAIAKGMYELAHLQLQKDAIAIDARVHLNDVNTELLSMIERGSLLSECQTYLQRMMLVTGTIDSPLYEFSQRHTRGCNALLLYETQSIKKMQLEQTTNVEVSKGLVSLRANIDECLQAWSKHHSKMSADMMQPYPSFVFDASSKLVVGSWAPHKQIQASLRSVVQRHLHLNTFMDSYVTKNAERALMPSNGDSKREAYNTACGAQARAVATTLLAKQHVEGMTLADITRGVEIILTVAVQSIATASFATAYAPSVAPKPIAS